VRTSQLLGIQAIALACAFVMSSCKPRINSSGLSSANDEYDGFEGQGLSGAEARGQRIWYEATGDNGRFHTYVTGQKLGAPENWYKVLASQFRDQRWKTWGLIPDPDCRPADDSSYGFDVCKGDKGDDGTVAPQGKGYQGLLAYVGKPGYKDPGCWISGQYQQKDCALGLGTSTGALGYRKFPNPRFNPAKWSGWNNFDPADGSIEPPFLIGTACGSCHISFNPLAPPADPNHPQWRNIRGLVGNQYEHISEIIGSGLNPHSFEWQAETNAPAGTADTSAHPNDLIYNPGTVNSIINIDKRPPGFPKPFAGDAYKSFDKTVVDASGHREVRRVFNILKGGEDDVGGAGAILRVYINIGTCSESCWVNHLLDNRSISGRGSEQTPFHAAQCRRDCPAYAALEDHYSDVLSFFTTTAGRPTDLKDAMFPNDRPEARYTKLVQSLGADKVALGRSVFAKNCASCHSSQKPPEGQTSAAFFNDLVNQSKTTGQDPFLREENGIRVDWLGNEEREPASVIGTNRCRALHSNHLRGHIWDEFSSETYKTSPTPPGLPELANEAGGGRGYYRNISLLSVWTQAPFMHNNGIGPDLCNALHPTAPCIDVDSVRLADGHTVSLPSVQGRLALFDASMAQLLNPEQRGRKITRTDQDIVVPLGPQANIDVAAVLGSIPYLSNLSLLLDLWGAKDVAQALKGMSIVIPKGTPVSLLASLDYRKLVKGLERDIAGASVTERPRKLVDLLNAMFHDPDKLADLLETKGYSNCTDVIEDKGHEFGATLSPQEKTALIAFMKTL